MKNYKFVRIKKLKQLYKSPTMKTKKPMLSSSSSCDVKPKPSTTRRGREGEVSHSTPFDFEKKKTSTHINTKKKIKN
jgi:hypothetical protein